MRDLATLTIHLLVTIARLLGPGGVRSIDAESLLLKHQLLILNRSRARTPALHPADRFFVGFGYCSKTLHDIEFPQGSGETEISPIVYTEQSRKTWPQRTLPRIDFSDCRHETKKSAIRVSAYCQSNFIHLQHPGRQRCGTPRADYALQAGTGFWRSVMAHIPGAYKGQSLECGPVSM